MDIAGSERASLQVAELVEDEQRAQAFGLEVAVPGRAFLLAVNRALGIAHVMGDALRRTPIMHCVDPLSWQIYKGCEVL